MGGVLPRWWGGGGGGACYPGGNNCCMLGTLAEFSLPNFVNNPKFDFLTVLNNDSEDDNNLNFSFSDSPYDSSNISCSYICENDFITKYRNCRNPSVLSINIQSLSAKFNELRTFINSLLANDCAPDLICLQEIWKIHDPDLFVMDGYHPLVYKCRRNDVQGGGVGIYIRNSLSFSVNDDLSIFVDRVLESIFVDVSFNLKIFSIGSIYRPGTLHPSLTATEQFSQFI